MSKLNPLKITRCVTITDPGGTIAADVLNLNNNGAVSVAILDGSGNQITSFGGGTQYAQGAVQPTPTGTVAMGKDPSNAINAFTLDASGNLNVNLAAGSITGGNGAASPTGSAVPSQADYLGIRVGANLIGVTGFSVGTSNAQAVAIVDGSGNQITSFGGGTQYAEGVTQATATGTVMLGKFGTTIKAAQTDASGNMSVVFPSAQPVTGVFFQATQPVSIASMPSTPVTGTFWQATQPVSIATMPSTPVTGTFWQATQPVSIAALPALVAGTAVIGHVIVDSAPPIRALTSADQITIANASLAVTGAFFQATQPISGAVSFTVPQHVIVDSSASIAVTGAFFQATQPVSIASMPSTPVTGTFWQVTQPVSIASMPTTAVKPDGTVWTLTGTSANANITNASIAVTGTFFQATQPVSIASMPTTPVTGTFFQATQPVSLATLPALTAGTAVIGHVIVDSGAVTATQGGTWTVQPGNTPNSTAWLVNGPTLTKATQGTVGFAVQDLKDSGRSNKNIFLDSFAVAATTETLMTMSVSTDNAAATTGTSYNVTAGKRFRIQSVFATLHTITGNTTAVNVIIRLRTTAGGTAILTSPLQAILALSGVASANGASVPIFMDIPDGWELASGVGIGVTVASAGFVATTAAPKVDISIIGYEY